MLFVEMTALNFDNHTEYIITLCEMIHVKECGTYIYKCFKNEKHVKFL
jgi:hypothetical protein